MARALDPLSLMDVLHRKVVPRLGFAATSDGLVGLLARSRGLGSTSREDRAASRIDRILGAELPDPSSIDVCVLGWLHEARVREGRADRRALGSYYTPASVVESIVRSAVVRPFAARLEGCPARRIRGRVLGFRVCDPAMGAGFFLVGALRAMTAACPGIRSPRSAIARSCLFGLDVDAGAVRLARLSLWLEAADPRLERSAFDGHLRSGNALAGEAADFPHGGSGFDAVVGNPPYGGLIDPGTRAHVAGRYRTGRGYRNTALHFLERSHDLLSPGGRAGLIVPKSLTYSAGWGSAVRLILPGLEAVIDASLAFEGVRLEQVIVVFSRARSRSRTYTTGSLERGRVLITGRLPRRTYEEAGVLLSGVTREEIRIFRLLQGSCRKLGEVSTSFRGLGIQRFAHPEGDLEAIHGKAIGRFVVRGPLGRFRLDRGLAPGVRRLRVRPKIVSQNVVAHVRRPEPRLVLMSAMDLGGRLTLDTVTNTVITDPDVDPWFVLAVLNSRFMSWYAHAFVFGRAIRTMHLDAGYIGRFPLPLPDAAPLEQRRAAGLARSLSRMRSPGARARDALEELERAVRACYALP